MTFVLDSNTTSLNSLLAQQVVYAQPREGYRVAVEAPLLAHFAISARRFPFKHAIDLGAGPGAIGLMLLAMKWANYVTAVEQDPMHVALAHYNVDANHVADQCRITQTAISSMTTLQSIEQADLVISNPPYFEPTSGPVSSIPARTSSRAWIDTSLLDFIKAARRLLGLKGRFVIAYPVASLTKLFELLESVGLIPKRMRLIYPKFQREAQIAFVESKVGRPGGLIVEAPLYVRANDEKYTQEVDAILQGRWAFQNLRCK